MYGMVRGHIFVIEIFQCLVKIDEDQWVHTNGEINMNE